MNRAKRGLARNSEIEIHRIEGRKLVCMWNSLKYMIINIGPLVGRARSMARPRCCEKQSVYALGVTYLFLESIYR